MENNVVIQILESVRVNCKPDSRWGNERHGSKEKGAATRQLHKARPTYSPHVFGFRGGP